MEVNVLWVIVLLGLVLFGGEIKFNGLFYRLLRRSEGRELRDGKQKALDE